MRIVQFAISDADKAVCDETVCSNIQVQKSSSRPREFRAWKKLVTGHNEGTNQSWDVVTSQYFTDPIS